MKSGVCARLLDSCLTGCYVMLCCVSASSGLSVERVQDVTESLSEQMSHIQLADEALATPRQMRTHTRTRRHSREVSQRERESEDACLLILRVIVCFCSSCAVVSLAEVDVDAEYAELLADIAAEEKQAISSKPNVRVEEPAVAVAKPVAASPARAATSATSSSPSKTVMLA